MASTINGKSEKMALNAIACARKPQPSLENRSAASLKAEKSRPIGCGISVRGVDFPGRTAVIVLLDGRAIPSYGGAYEAGGRILGPVVPFVSAVAERGWRDSRRGLRARRLPGAHPRGSGGLERQDVALAAAMRGLGERVLYDAHDARCS